MIEYANGDLILPGPKGFLLIIYCAVCPSILSQTCFIRGVELTGANRAGLYVNLVPVFAAFLGMLILSEAMHIYHLIALIMVLGGIFWQIEVKYNHAQIVIEPLKKYIATYVEASDPHDLTSSGRQAHLAVQNIA